MLDLSRQYAGIRTEILAAVTRACDSQRYILGDEVTAFEREFAALCGTTEAVGCASGTDGLWLALAAAGVSPGDSVITTPFSFFATASSILRAGAHPVFADIDPETLNLDPVSVEERLKTSPLDMRPSCPSISMASALTWTRSSALPPNSTCTWWKTRRRPWAQRGMANAPDLWAWPLRSASIPQKISAPLVMPAPLPPAMPPLAEHMRSLRNHGGKQRYYHDEIGANSRLDSIQAAVLRVKMTHLASGMKRAANAAGRMAAC